MHRFFVSADNINDDTIILPSNISRQLTYVLRSLPGDRIVILDNLGWEYTVVLKTIDRDQVVGLVENRSLALGEPETQITLYQGVLKANRFELILQKCTELGVSRFVPLLSKRSIPLQRDDHWFDRRYTRWSRIIMEAAEQSRRGKIPKLEKPAKFEDACKNVEGLALIPWELHETTGMKTALTPLAKSHNHNHSISIFIGPEGGFTENEIATAVSNDIKPISLGKRIFRAETAGIVTVSAILYQQGELGD